MATGATSGCRRSPSAPSARPAGPRPRASTPAPSPTQISAIVPRETRRGLAPDLRASRSSGHRPHHHRVRPALEGRRHLGVDIPVAWGVAIVNFVWWIGIGHAARLISAILLLLNQRWRTSINRFAEDHDALRGAVRRHVRLPLGRPCSLLADPLPGHMRICPVPQPPSWDFFAVTAYLTISLLSGTWA